MFHEISADIAKRMRRRNISRLQAENMKKVQAQDLLALLFLYLMK